MKAIKEKEIKKITAKQVAVTELAEDNPYHESNHKVARVYPLKYEAPTDLEDVLELWHGPDVSFWVGMQVVVEARRTHLCCIPPT